MSPTSRARHKVPRSAAIPTLCAEVEMGYPQVVLIGVDEVGRGCLAGPVMAGAFVVSGGVLPEWMSKVRDSKLLSARQREALSPVLREHTDLWAVAEASVDEIDRYNILQAAELAMKRAVDRVVARLAGREYRVLVDGNRIPKHFHDVGRAIVGGDRTSLSIACASILAKVDRDARLDALEVECPGYGLSVHKGYGTPVHLEALAKLGPSPHHRQSFAPVRAAKAAMEDSPGP